MPKKISESVIVITGASSGIGRATALEAAAGKAAVVLVSRQEAALNEIAQECERLGGRALAVRADVTDEKEVLHAAAVAIDKFGRIDAWVNAAGVSLLSGFEDAPSDVFRRVIETNFFGYVYGARAALAQFRKQNEGVLINISSILGKIGAPFASAYSASKFAVAGFSESLRMELQNVPDIHVCTVFPSTVDTPLFQHAANYTGRAVAAPPPIHQPEEVAAAILKCVVKPTREITVGNVKSTVAMRTAAPAYTEKSFAARIDKEHFQDRPAPASHGNLFDSMPSFNTVHGGWSSGVPHSQKMWFGASLAALVAGVAVAWFLRSSERRERAADLARNAGTAARNYFRTKTEDAETEAHRGAMRKASKLRAEMASLKERYAGRRAYAPANGTSHCRS